MKKKTLLFFGLGRIGLPQSLVFADAGHKVYGYDIDRNVIAQIKECKIPFFEPELETLLKENIDKNFIPIEKWNEIINNIDAVIFTLGTAAPDSESCLVESEGDLSLIESLLSEIFENRTNNKKIGLIFRTTLFLGSTDRIKNYIEESYDKTEGEDFTLTFVPERLMEGNAVNEERTLPKIVGAYSQEGFDLAEEIFSLVGGEIIKVKNPRTAEFCKLSDNSYRSTSFAFANEIAMWASCSGVDVHEVINAINSSYARNNVAKPGFVSGYCLGKDPYIFEYGFKKKMDRGFQSIWYQGRKTNDYLTDYVVEKTVNWVVSKKKSQNQIKIAVLGLSFKEDVDDFRMSHAVDLIKKLRGKGFEKFFAYDPAVGTNKYTSTSFFDIGCEIDFSNTIDSELLKDVNVLIVAHRHRELRDWAESNLKELLKNAARPLYIFDVWNIWRPANLLDGVEYESLGFKGERI